MRSNKLYIVTTFDHKSIPICTKVYKYWRCACKYAKRQNISFIGVYSFTPFDTPAYSYYEFKDGFRVL